jgi:vanillate O-demethylase monooxygenase subunit
LFIKNAWYVAAWLSELSYDRPLARKICGDAVVLFQTGEDSVSALADACIHRQYPLSSGKIVDGNIRCGYHGFEYDPSGVCLRVPGQSNVPPKAKVRNYPTVVKDGWVWIWPGEYTDPPDPGLIPDTHWLTSDSWVAVRFTKYYDCNSGLLHDNLLDLTHEAFIHEASIGDDAVYENGVTVEVTPSSVVVDRYMPSCHPSQLYVTAMGVEPPMDRWHTTEFNLPSLHVIHCGVGDPGKAREEGYHIEVLNAITPATENSTWYFYANARDFAIHDDSITSLMEKSLEVVLDEDAEALEKQALSIESGAAHDHDVLVAQDAGVARARRMLRSLVAAEAEASAGGT